MSAKPAKKPAARIILPKPYPIQEIFVYWKDLFPKSQCLVAPCGVKVGKSFGAAIWLLREALSTKGLFCVWIAPTYLKAKIGYRYIKNMLPDCHHFNPVDGKLEIRFANGSYIKFLHGRDAEITVEGEAVDRFVIDESGKTAKQVWYSLLTTITQTQGLGIITGTPRGFTWYYELFEKAKTNDPFFCFAQITTDQSPFVKPEAIANAKRLLPKFLFDQYYRALFLTQSSVFGDLTAMWDESIQIEQGLLKFWIHPNEELRQGYCVHGVDIAKSQDFTVFYSVNLMGQLVGFCRFNQTNYTAQVIRLKTYIINYFGIENKIRYDATGVGVPFGDMLSEAEIDADIEPVVFSNKSKNEMVTKTIIAVEQGWHKAPRITAIEKEFTTYEMNVSTSGMYRFAAQEGEHDDVVSAAIMAISDAHAMVSNEHAEKVLSNALGSTQDELTAYASSCYDDSDDNFFDDNKQDYDEDLGFDLNDM